MDRAAALLDETLVWDNHGCMPLRPGDVEFLPQLDRYRRAGVDVVLLNVGFDGTSVENDLGVLATFRRWIGQNGDRYRLVGTADDILAARRAGKLSIAFNLEGFGALGGQVDLVSTYYDLGVRWMLVAYNQNNAGGGGCQDEDRGLTDFGRRVVAEMERVGMAVCCSHTGYRTALDVMAHARRPVILSHSNPRALVDHPRNVPDEVMQACAETGGVMGITGVSLFLGDSKPNAERIVDHIEYAVGKIGVDHVGLGIDTCFDNSEVLEYMKTMPERFPTLRGYDDGMNIAGPEVIPAVAQGLLARGFSEADAAKVMGGNFLRVAGAVWRDRSGGSPGA